MSASSAQGSPSRNAPCPCGSGKKYKRCCGQSGKAEAGKPQPQLQQVIDLYQQGRLAAAGKHAEDLLRKQPDDPALIEISAAIALQTGNATMAMERFTRQTQLQPRNALAHSNLCMTLHTLGRDEDAFMHGQQATQLDPNLADAWNNLGNIYKNGNHLKAALEHYDKALDLCPADPEILVNAGSASQLLGDLESAEGHYRRALESSPGFIPALNNLGAVLQKQQKYEAADTTFRQALEIQPDNPETLTNYGNLMLEQHETDEARTYFDKAIRIAPDYVGTWVSMASLHDRLNDQESVAQCQERVLQIDPENTTIHCNIGYRLYELGEQKQAVEHFVRALKSNPNSAKGLAGLGKAMLRQNENEKAAEYIVKALQIAPWDMHAHIANAHLLESQHKSREAGTEWQDITQKWPLSVEGWIGLAGFYMSLGQYDMAREQFRHAEKNDCKSMRLYNNWSQMEEHIHDLDEAERLAECAFEYDHVYPGLKILKSKLSRRRKEFPEALEHLLQVDIDKTENQMTRAAYFFELGAVHDKLGNYPAAIEAYDEATRAKNQYIGYEYNHESDAQRFRRWASLYNEENWQQAGKSSADVNTHYPHPVFILGFPRSGTSLLEQILGSHPEIAPAGELTFIKDIAEYESIEILGSKKGYPACLFDSDAPLDRKKINTLRDHYLDKRHKLGVTDDNTHWVTDKMPHNSIHVGLIKLLFPLAPIIHIARHPLNSCLSAYFANFMSGHRYTSSLKSTAQHFVLVMDMLEHYRQIGIDFLRIRYEDLVNDQENTVRILLNYIDAPWDDACMAHHKSKRVVRTASYEQVTQKIYTSSLNRYQNYWEAVQEIIPILQPVIDRFGYTVEPPPGKQQTNAH